MQLLVGAGHAMSYSRRCGRREAQGAHIPPVHIMETTGATANGSAEQIGTPALADADPHA